MKDNFTTMKVLKVLDKIISHQFSAFVSLSEFVVRLKTLGNAWLDVSQSEQLKDISLKHLFSVL